MSRILKRIGRTFVAVITCLCMCMTWSTSTLIQIAQAAQLAGSFELVAVSSDGIFIGPETVPYTQGQTILEALQATDHTFKADASSGFLSEVDGHTDGFNLYLQDSSYDLTQPASKAEVLYIRETDGATDSSFDADFASLLKFMATYAHSTDGLKNYTPAKTAYASAVKDLYYVNTASGGTSTKYATALGDAIAAWNTLQAGTRRSITFSAIQGGSTVQGASLSVVDEWGNQQALDGMSASLLVGSTYTYTLAKDGSQVSVKATIASMDSTLTAALPTGSWIGDVTLFHQQKELSTAFAHDDDTYVVPDYVVDDTGYGIYVNVEMGADCDDSATLRANGTAIAWEATTTKINGLVSRGLTGAQLNLEARLAVDENTVQSQSRTIQIVRTGSLSSLSVTDNDVELLADFQYNSTSYTVCTTADQVMLTPTAAGAYAMDVDGDALASGASISVSASSGQGSAHQVNLTVNGYANTYTVTVVKKDSVNVILNHAADVEIDLRNDAGGCLAPVSTTATSSVYSAVKGGEYTYVATAQDVYHLRKSFTADEDCALQVSTPQAEEWVASLDLYTGTGKAAWAYDHKDGWSYSASCHDYTWIVGDTDTSTALGIQGTQQAVDSAVTATVQWDKQNTGETTSLYIQNATIKTAGKCNLGMFHRKGTVGNSAQLVLSSGTTTEAGETPYQDYVLRYVVQATLGDLTVDCDGTRMTLAPVTTDTDVDQVFDRDILEYEVRVPDSTTEATVGFSFPVGSSADDLVYGTYALDFNGEAVSYTTETFTRDVSLIGEETQVLITVKGTSDASALSATYKVTIKKAASVPVSFITTPADASVTVVREDNNNRIWPDDQGTYELLEGFSYRYTVAAVDYVGQKGTFTAEKGMGNMTVILAKAAESPDLDKAITASWPYFRADENNNGVVNYATPTSSDDATLYWATKLGDGYSSGATGCPILVDGYLYSYAGTHIYKVDTVNGQVVAEGEMVASSSFAINSPTYADGMIFVGLSKGRVQAFNAKTLESMWVYTDDLGGQPNCPIAYKKGKIYTGFWNSETKQANFVCLSTTDENPSETTESKIPLWTHADNGFYWAGCYVSDDFLLVGTDDGDSGYLANTGKMLSLDPSTGKVIDSLTDLVGDVRSSVCYDTESGRYYFTSKGGYFYGIDVNEQGVIDHDKVSRLHLYNYADDDTKPPMSTCTPCIYNGRAYIGVSGTGQFSSYSGHNITVIDLKAGEPRIAYTVRTQGYPQTSGLVTTAYDKGDGTVYVYFFDNYTPGVLRVLKDKPGQTEPDVTVAETSPSGTTYDCASVLFTPSGAQAQYAICSPVADDYGTIYFKNDSAYVMAVGAKITKIQVTKQPTKTTYKVGETFSTEGMQVTATYSNGKTRDVTKYVSVDTTTPLKASDTDMEITFDSVMYHDQDGKAGATVIKPSTSVSITVTSPVTKKSIAGKTAKLSYSKVAWNGKAKKPTVTISGLKSGTDFKVSYKSNTACGTAKVTVTGMGNYYGTITKTFKIVPKKVAAPKVTAGKRRLTVGKWAKTGATKYRVQVKVFGGKWVTKKTVISPRKVVIKGLKKGKKYRVRIVSYSKVGTTVGKMSTLRKVK